MLVLKSPAHSHIRIGKLGNFNIEEGYFYYAGSAFGPGGLSGRINHHLKLSGCPHWHIDYLRKVTQPIEVWVACERHLEHQWAARLATNPEMQLPLSRFGASDCHCPAHLFFTKTLLIPDEILEIITTTRQDRNIIERWKLTG